jgi:hypothetical protein
MSHKEHSHIMAGSAALAAVLMAQSLVKYPGNLPAGIELLNGLRETALDLSDGEGDAPIAAHLAQRAVEILASGGSPGVARHYLARADWHSRTL